MEPVSWSTRQPSTNLPMKGGNWIKADGSPSQPRATRFGVSRHSSPKADRPHSVCSCRPARAHECQQMAALSGKATARKLSLKTFCAVLSRTTLERRRPDQKPIRQTLGGGNRRTFFVSDALHLSNSSVTSTNKVRRAEAA